MRFRAFRLYFSHTFDTVLILFFRSSYLHVGG
jgi:hypothetical protein